MSTININNLTVKYDKNTVIENLDLDIPQGKITVFLGGNGCGKSTLLKTLVKVKEFTKGEISINNKNIHNIKQKELSKVIAFLPQSPVCPSGTTVKDLVSFGRYPHQGLLSGLNSYDLDVINSAMSQTGVLELQDRLVSQLSGGQRQRAWISMTLAQETETIILDEPIAYLDMSYQLEVLEILKELNNVHGKTILIVLHELNLASKIADHIVGLRDGKVIFEGKPNDVITGENLKKIYDVKARIEKYPDLDYPLCIDYNLIEK